MLGGMGLFGGGGPPPGVGGAGGLFGAPNAPLNINAPGGSTFSASGGIFGSGNP